MYKLLMFSFATPELTAIKPAPKRQVFGEWQSPVVLSEALQQDAAATAAQAISAIFHACLFRLLSSKPSTQPLNP